MFFAGIVVYIAKRFQLKTPAALVTTRPEQSGLCRFGLNLVIADNIVLA